VLDAIKFEHTVFALPFAYIAMVLAAGGWPGWWTVGWVTAAMVGGRTCAMATNRVVDRFIDARNPRTAGRHLPRRLLGVGEMRLLAAAGAVLMLVASWMLNPLCFTLAPLALVFLQYATRIPAWRYDKIVLEIIPLRRYPEIDRFIQGSINNTFISSCVGSPFSRIRSPEKIVGRGDHGKWKCHGMGISPYKVQGHGLTTTSV